MTQAPVTDLGTLRHALLKLNEVAALYGLSPATIRTKLSRNTFRPLPFDKYPYRWRRDDVIHYLQTRRPNLNSRRRRDQIDAAMRLLGIVQMPDRDDRLRRAHDL
jgi:predicted DNA-binding transcriptional regulator AlpA